ncbi:hypothetical protein [Streptomyces sp. SID1121]|uniref:hypothetical protein n=1 Tax=Streptomyces sp. SID1121 TaxID=3425888 RepID=UPI004056B4BA
MSAEGATGAGGAGRAAGVALISGDLAAAEVEVSPATIRKWVQLGHLTAAGRQGRRLLYRLEDVFAAERAARRRN